MKLLCLFLLSAAAYSQAITVTIRPGDKISGAQWYSLDIKDKYPRLPMLSLPAGTIRAEVGKYLRLMPANEARLPTRKKILGVFLWGAWIAPPTVLDSIDTLDLRYKGELTVLVLGESGYFDGAEAFPVITIDPPYSPPPSNHKQPKRPTVATR
jgi:hypothetical protein